MADIVGGFGYRPIAMSATGPVPSADAAVVRPFEADDEARVLELLEAAFTDWPHDVEGVTASEFFHWKHMANPFGRSILLVAEAGGEVVGFAAWLRWRLTGDGGTLETLRGVDFVVHPSHRGRGIPVAMIRTATELFSEDVALTFSCPNERSRSGALKSGRHEVGRLRGFVRLHRPLRGPARGIFGKGQEKPEQPRIAAETAAEALEDGVDVTRLLAQTTESSDRLATARDLDYLRWRYCSLKDYWAVRADAGMVIFRLRHRGSALVSRVCELLVTPNDHRAARHLLRQVREAAPADYATCNFPSRRDAVRCGFVGSSGGPNLVAHPLRQNLVPDPTRRASWALSMGDLEVL